MPARTHAVPMNPRLTPYSHVLAGGARPAHPGRPPVVRIVRWVVLLLALGVTALSLQAAIGEDEGLVHVQVACGPTPVGIATDCTATIIGAAGTNPTDDVPAAGDAPSFLVKIGTYDNEQGGQPTRAQAIARAERFDVITAGAHQYRWNVAAMRAANPNLVLRTYVNGTHTRDAGLPEAQYCHDQAGRRITSNGLWAGNILMDPANSGWRTTLLAEVNDVLATSGYDGVFLDVLGRGALQYNVTGHCINPRTGGPYTTAAWERDTSELARSIKERSARSLVANGASRGVIYFSPPPSSVIAQYADGGLAEGFTRNGAFFEGHYSESQLLKDVAMVSDGPIMHVLTKDWRAVSQNVKDREMRYAFATFLLGTDGNDVFGWTGSQGTMTPFDPLWDTDLGAPGGPYYSVGTGAFSPRLRSRPCARGHRLPHRFDRGRPHGRPHRDVELERCWRVRSVQLHLRRRFDDDVSGRVHAWPGVGRSPHDHRDRRSGDRIRRRHRHDDDRGGSTPVDDHRLVRNASDPPCSVGLHRDRARHERWNARGTDR